MVNPPLGYNWCVWRQRSSCRCPRVASSWIHCSYTASTTRCGGAPLLATDDPTGEIQAAWAGKELLRQLLDALPASSGSLVVDPRRDPDPASRRAAAGLRPYEVRARLARFYDLAAQADVPELERLASTVETWWPAIAAYLRLRVTNARTEGYNRKIKQIKRVSCGFRNQNSYERRIMLNNAATAA